MVPGTGVPCRPEVTARFSKATTNCSHASHIHVHRLVQSVHLVWAEYVASLQPAAGLLGCGRP
jgi:hypothetical protein